MHSIKEQDTKPKTHFSVEEDCNLIMLVKTYGTEDWKNIAKMMKNRTARQCKERWVNYLQPGLNNQPWTQEEDNKLIEMVKLYGNSWSKIKHCFARRTDINIKNRWSKLSRMMENQKKQKVKNDKKEEQEKKNELESFDSLFFAINQGDLFE